MPICLCICLNFQSLNRLWEEYIIGRPEVEIPTQLLKYTELVLDTNRNLVERKRLPGENDVSIYLCSHCM